MKANLTQEEVARRMGTTQSVVARLESGKPQPSLYHTVVGFAPGSWCAPIIMLILHLVLPPGVKFIDTFTSMVSDFFTDIRGVTCPAR